MKHAKSFVVALLVGLSATALVVAQKAPDTLAERYPELLAADHEPTIVNFTATWCGPCQRLKPHLASLKAEGYRVKIYDIDQHPQLFAYFHGSTIPLTCLWKDEMIQKRWVGIVDLTTHLTPEYKIRPAKEQKDAEKMVPPQSNQTSAPGEAASGPTTRRPSVWFDWRRWFIR